MYTPIGGLMGPVSPFASHGSACKDIWVSLIQQAQTSIRVNAYCISDPDIIEELRRAAAPARGVSVRVRYDARQQAKTQQGIFEDDRMRHVQAHPVEVSADERVIMHKKELIVDVVLKGHPEPQARLVIGSFNPTCNARGNQESVVTITDVETLHACALRFDHDWAQEVKNHRQREIGASFSSTPDR